MNVKKWVPLISMASVLIMFVWGYLAGSFAQSWLAVFAGGIAVAALTIIGKKQPENEKDESEEK